MGSFASTVRYCVLLSLSLNLLLPADAIGSSSWHEGGAEFAGGQSSGVDVSEGSVQLDRADPAAGNWTKLGDGVPSISLHEPFYNPASGQLLVPGQMGWLWRYDLELDRWSSELLRNMPHCWGEMVFDSDAQRFILFGSRWWDRGSYSFCNETWVLDVEDCTWTNVTKRVAPSPREDLEMALDEVNRVVVLFGGYRYGSLGETWSLDLATLNWSRVITTPEPSRRDDHHMVYDPDAKLCILHGGHYGQNPDPQSGTWAFNASNGTWSMFEFGDVWPYERYDRQQMVYDRSTDLIVLFEGTRTWTFNCTVGEWTRMAPTVEPAVADFEMTYSDAAGVTVLFGRNETDYMRNAVWTYDCTNDEWTEVALRELPIPKMYDSVSFDRVNGKAVVYGGYYEYYDASAETWSYDMRTNEWTRMRPAKTPLPLIYHGMTYDSKEGVHVLFGGASERYVWYTNDTWSYNLTKDSWTNVTTANSPPARTSGALAFDEGEGVVVLFGGNLWNSTKPMDTWKLDTATRTWTEIVTGERPPSRDYRTVYDRANRRIVAFSGPDLRWFAWTQWRNYNYTEVWALDVANGTWTNCSPPDSPLSREGFAVAYDEVRGETLLFGGSHRSYDFEKEGWVYIYENLSWSYNLSEREWTSTALTGPLVRREECSIGQDSATGAMFIITGWYRDFPDSLATQRFAGDVWASNLSTFLENGTYTSAPRDTGGEAFFGWLVCNATTDADTWLGLQLRGANSSGNLTTHPFIGPDGTSRTYYPGGTSRLDPALNGSRWVQYRAELRTYNPLMSPSLLNVTVGYNLRHTVRAVSPAGGETWAGPRTFSWEADDRDNDALTFDVLLVNATARLRIGAGLPDDSRSVDFDLVNVADGTYWMLVEAHDDDLDIPLWSNATSGEFTVLDTPPTVELLSPSNGAIVRSPIVKLMWNGSDVDGNSLFYRVLVSDVQFQPSSPPSTWTSTSARALEVGPLEDGKTYYWTVIPFDGRVEGLVVQIWSFTVAIPKNTPPSVILLSPDDGAVTTKGTIELRWDATDADGDPLSFQVYVSTVPFDVSGPPVPIASTLATSYTLTELTDRATYYWTVIADDSNGSRYGPYPWRFLVQLPPVNHPPVAGLLSPVDGSTVSTTSVRLEWTGSDPDGDLITFFLVLSLTPFDPATPPPFLTSTMTRSFVASDLVDGATYHWTVVPHDGRTNGTAPVVQSFKVMLPPPPNVAPRFASVPPTEATVGTQLVHQLAASDEDGDALTFMLLDAPAGMELDASSGRLEWTPASDQMGDNHVVVRVTDGRGGMTDQSFTIHVEAVPVPPHTRPWCRISLPTNGSTVKGRLTVNGTTGPGSMAVALAEVSVDGGDWLAATGIGNWTFLLDTSKLANGEHTLSARAFDGTDHSEVVSVHLTVDNKKKAHRIPGLEGIVASVALALAALTLARDRPYRKG